MTTQTEKQYQVVNGTFYHEETPKKVIDWLETSRQRQQRIRIFYGDTVTGRDWLEEYDTMGIIGRSSGNVSIPLMIKSIRSYGGGALLDHCIVKITVNKKTVYQHPSYHIGEITIKESHGDLKEKGYTHMVFVDGKNQANFESLEKAEKYIKFIKGESNKH